MHIKNISLSNHNSDYPLLYIGSKFNNSILNKRKLLIEEANRLVGSPYIFGAYGPTTFDSCGFVRFVYKRSININLPRTLIDQINYGKYISSITDLNPGDLVFVSKGTHVGIYIGNNEIIHSPFQGKRVKSSLINNFYCGVKYI